METRSLADFLRSRSDDEMLALLAARPDLVSPVPADIASLAVRASSAPSIARAVDGLNKWQLQVLEAATALEEPFSEKEIIDLTDKAAKFVIPVLLERALIYSTDEGLRVPGALRDVIGYEPAGLGPASMSRLKLSKLKEAPAEAKKVLDQLMWGPPRGSVGDIKKPSAGVAWLLEENFLIPKDQRTVLMPREVALYLRGGKAFKECAMQPPEITTESRTAKGIQLSAIANITTILRWVEEMLNFWSQEPADALRAGGLGLRELRTVAAHLGVDETCAAFVAELAYLAGLVVVDSDDRILPTNSFDIWLTQSASDKWQALTAPWLITSRVPGLVGRAESKNVAALGPELDRISAAPLRKLTLELLAECTGAPDIASLVAHARWRAPSKRTGGIHEDLVRWTVREAEWLGITGQGALSKYGRGFLEGADLSIIDSDLPIAVDHILIQSDNTAIAPGPLVHEVAQELALIADVESRGGATVYRFSEQTLRRALDHGKTGDEIRTFLKKVSKTPVPQPLEYLITDISKKHGKLRVGNTSSFIRCEDPGVVAEIINDKRLESLRLRRIAPEVIISDLDATDVLTTLRGVGYLPAAENSQGLILSGTSIQRAKVKARPPRILGEIEEPSPELLRTALRAIHTGEKSSARQSALRVDAKSLPRTSANETLDILIKHMTKNPKGALSIGYADNNGGVTHRIVDPLKIHAGALIARDHATGELTPFKIARITGVAEL